MPGLASCTAQHSSPRSLTHKQLPIACELADVAPAVHAVAQVCRLRGQPVCAHKVGTLQ
jgi:hypothetical protein